ncbi:PREDICTED: splicing factor 1-like [Priapulus caudatus]|uniref:Splicing factor 1-like n=1 Tax=Priapulus caudatus TaxID=37621 RepID=A0ABM1EV42_PRICU|nr:PREDICTED: splicing factor 1-like [Priapulus caudatus]
MLCSNTSYGGTYYQCPGGKECCNNVSQGGCCNPRQPSLPTYGYNNDHNTYYGVHHYTLLSFWNMWYFWFIVISLLIACFGVCGYWRRRHMWNLYGPGPYSGMHGMVPPSRYLMGNRMPGNYRQRFSGYPSLFIHHDAGQPASLPMGSFPEPPPYSEVVAKPESYPPPYAEDTDSLPPYSEAVAMTPTSQADNAMLTPGGAEPCVPAAEVHHGSTDTINQPLQQSTDNIYPPTALQPGGSGLAGATRDNSGVVFVTRPDGVSAPPPPPSPPQQHLLS